MIRRTRSLLNSVRCSTFEYNEAVIKMIIKGRSPTMRHVSRIHRVALDLLCDRINLDPKIQIKYVDTTKHQIADILTKGDFTRDEWNNLCYLCNISHFSLICCSQNISMTSCAETMAKRMLEQKGEERIVAKSKTTMNLAFTVSISSDCVEKSGCTQGTRSKMIGQVQGDLEQRIWTCPKKEFTQDPASSSQAWQKDAVLDESTRRLVAREEDQEHLNFTEDPKNTRRLVASGNSDRHQRQRRPHNLHISTDCVPHMEKVLSIVRQRYGLRDKNGKPCCERSYLVYIHVCHSSSCSSFWDRLYGECAFHQESVQEIIETVVSSDSEADH